MNTFNRGLLRILALAVLCFSVSANASDISAEIHVDKNWLKASDDVLVAISLTNHGKKPARVLKWYTAANGIEDSLFSVNRDGHSLRYLGAHYKRPAAHPGNYLNLKAGETVTHIAELSAVYDFSKTGDYSIRFKVESLSLFNPGAEHRSTRSQFKMPSLISNELMVWVQGRETDWSSMDEREYDRGGNGNGGGGNGGGNGGGKPGGEDPPTGERISFTGRCSNGEKSTILTAIDEAIGISSDSQSYLNNNITGDRYTTWFGTVSSGRYHTVENNFTEINDAIINADITVDCKCKQNYYAYVYPSQPYKIYVCKAFWAAPMTGTDSKAGTLVHEMSHFDVVAGTDDVVYGQTGAKNLAISSPNDAIKNADSHEYFAENTPHQN
jgi:peptidyl-Lys metalloendopeptidase